MIVQDWSQNWEWQENWQDDGKSDDLKTDIICIVRVTLRMIEIMLDGQPDMMVFAVLTLDTNVHVFLSNIELR